MNDTGKRCQPDCAELIRDLRARRIMCDGGNGNVYDIADDVCEKAADLIESLTRATPAQPAGMREKIARAMQGANALRMLLQLSWDEIATEERDHWLFLADAALALPAERPAVAQAPSQWQPIATEPNDGNYRLYRLTVNHRDGTSWGEVHYLAWEDGGDMIDASGDKFSDWSHSDFEHWAEAPSMPSAQSGGARE